ncbi:MAG: hypothetical protein HKO64_02985 [Xanthomonadales bacterium]|nr:hypothetical protein [Xanthomonadales bacterium]
MDFKSNSKDANARKASSPSSATDNQDLPDLLGLILTSSADRKADATAATDSPIDTSGNFLTRSLDSWFGNSRPVKKAERRVHSRVSANRQRGSSLMEVMISMGLSVVVSMSAVQLLGNTMGHSSKVIQSTQLSHALRASMHVITRDVRRAGYTANAMWCMANTVCVPDLTVDLPLGGSFDMPGAIVIDDNDDCIIFQLDRNHDGTVSADEYGAYRRSVSGNVGILETWTGDSAPDCDAGHASWTPVTERELVDIVAFSLDTNDSFDEVVATDLLGNSTTQRVRRVHVSITGELINDDAVRLHIEDTIDVRNDIVL